MDQILPNLWLGTEQAARDVQQLQRHGITLVISIMNTRTRHKTKQAYAAANIAHHHFDAVDCDVHDLSVIAPAVHLLIEAQRDTGRATLVHCHLGKSRSAACVVYHLMQRGLDDEPQGFDVALAYVKDKRPVIDINAGFTRWLRTAPMYLSSPVVTAPAEHVEQQQ